MILINLLPHREEKRKRRKAAFFVGLGMSFAVGALIAAFIYLLLQQLTAAQASRNDYLKAEITKLDIQIKDIATLRAEIDALRARQRAVENLQSDRNTPVHLLNELAKFTPEGVFLQSVRQVNKAVVVAGVAASNERVSEMLRNLSRAEWVERARQRAVENLQSDRNTPVHLLNELAKFTPEGVFLQSVRQVNKAVVVAGVAASNERVSEMLRNLSRAEWVERPDLVEIKAAPVNPRDPRRLFDFSIKVGIKSVTPEPAAGAASGPGAKPATDAPAKKE